MLILFPSDYDNIKQPDPDYKKEYEAVCQIPDFKIILYNYDGFAQGEPIEIYPDNCFTGECIYRGWMLNPEQYTTLYEFLNARDIKLINTPEEYNICHLFPTIYPEIKQYTPKILYFEQKQPINWDLVNSTFTRFMVKDYVKSVKGQDFPAFFETPVQPEEMNQYIDKFIKLRGSLFTGDIVLKEYVELKMYSGRTNEYRAFYLLDLFGN